jgi:hypothetical protein
VGLRQVLVGYAALDFPQPVNPPCLRNGKGRLLKSVEAEYDRVAEKVDTMPLDTLFRIPKRRSPSPMWYNRRAKLNLFVLSVRSIGDDYVVIRLK